MSYVLHFTDDDERRKVPASLPSHLVDEVNLSLKELCDDPIKNSRAAPCPPYRPIGRVHFVKLLAEDRRYILTYFFHLDTKEELIHVRRVTLQPPYREPKKKKGEPSSQE